MISLSSTLNIAHLDTESSANSKKSKNNFIRSSQYQILSPVQAEASIRSLPKCGKRVLDFLANSHARNLPMKVAHDYIAQSIGYCRRQVKRSIDRLVALGLIAYNRYRKSYGLNDYCMFYLNQHLKRQSFWLRVADCLPTLRSYLGRAKVKIAGFSKNVTQLIRNRVFNNKSILQYVRNGVMRSVVPAIIKNSCFAFTKNDLTLLSQFCDLVIRKALAVAEPRKAHILHPIGYIVSLCEFFSSQMGIRPDRELVDELRRALAYVDIPTTLGREYSPFPFMETKAPANVKVSNPYQKYSGSSQKNEHERQLYLESHTPYVHKAPTHTENTEDKIANLKAKAALAPGKSRGMLDIVIRGLERGLGIGSCL